MAENGSITVEHCCWRFTLNKVGNRRYMEGHADVIEVGGTVRSPGNHLFLGEPTTNLQSTSITLKGTYLSPDRWSMKNHWI